MTEITEKTGRGNKEILSKEEAEKLLNEAEKLHNEGKWQESIQLLEEFLKGITLMDYGFVLKHFAEAERIRGYILSC